MESAEQLANTSAEKAEQGGTRMIPGNAPHSAHGETAETFHLSTNEVIVFVGLATLTLMAALDGTSISVAIPRISEELNGSAVEAFWAGTSFLLCSAVFQPVIGTLSGVLGRKVMVLIAIFFFFIGALLAGLARNFTHLLVGRSLQGLGGGGIITLCGIVTADIVPLSHRAKYFGIYSGMWSLGSVLGPVLGGCFVERATWRWIFYINFPFVGIGVVLMSIFMPFDIPRLSLADRARKIDYIGTVLFVASSSSFLIPVTWGGIMYPWTSWRTLVPLILGLVGLLGFALYEVYFPSNPIIPPRLFRNRTTAVSFAGYATVGLVLWCSLYYLPLYYEGVRGYGPILTGVALFPLTFTVAPSALVVGFLMNHMRSYRWAVWLGWILSTLGLGVLCALKVDTSIAGWIFMLLVPGLGVGLVIPSIAFAVQSSARVDDVVMAVAISTFFRSFGQSVGVAIGGTVFQNRLLHSLRAYPALSQEAQHYSQDATAVVAILKNMPDSLEKRELQQAFVTGLQAIWAVCCAVAGVTFFSSLLTKAYEFSASLGRIEKDGNGSVEPKAKHEMTSSSGPSVSHEFPEPIEQV